MLTFTVASQDFLISSTTTAFALLSSTVFSFLLSSTSACSASINDSLLFSSIFNELTSVDNTIASKHLSMVISFVVTAIDSEAAFDDDSPDCCLSIDFCFAAGEFVATAACFESVSFFDDIS